MAKLDGLESVLEFIKGLQPKIAAQISKKVLMLNLEPLPVDSKALKGYEGYYRVDPGEYRIVYRFDPESDLVEVILVGKRNDDEVYKQLSRLLD
ncbi:MAG: type II toxin-antitoxin system RelE/ParE family toxin [Leptolyngbya sp. UWPOB_LEPTO1]|uniref:type II toxin-antitoxin system RelE family toxin n=1 Tax=Leptolyngbya sp. UWPOB_LEPTO1 TaxID=2815653 RepID=UPI001AC99BF4|nr:type II toxin-antitoxin system RelE/ParE family toxin [Leptolyngbya sp. UWPOB_LEPTO1]MBN8560825.1 type II toxin-antitoxin system RelE/ParE family toxin [Leptolyngbya sp. UWPOB_LEPTO1]